ncbi:MAG: hypothetical protein ACFE9S_07660 [Candidatus Hermodarchaeota archaeon]
MINFNRLRKEVNQRNAEIAKIVSNVMFKDVTDEDWQILLEFEKSPFGQTLQMIQDEIYNYYVGKLIGELQASTQVNRQVDASIYGGQLEGIRESSLRALCDEARKRLNK